MKIFNIGIAIVLMVFLSVIAFADLLENYTTYKEKSYYLLDKQKFSKIECKVHVPFIENSLASSRQQLQLIPGNVVVEENMKDFLLIYSKSQGLSFKNPIFNIRALEQEKIKNLQNFSQGVQQMENGFKEQVNGVEKIITGVFDEYAFPSKKKVQSFTKSAVGAEATVESDGIISKEQYSASGRVTKFNGSGMTGVEQSQFEKIDNYFLLSKSDAQVQQFGEEINLSTLVSYNKLEGIIFPKSISNKMVIQRDGVKQEAQMDITLEECTVE